MHRTSSSEYCRHHTSMSAQCFTVLCDNYGLGRPSIQDYGTDLGIENGMSYPIASLLPTNKKYSTPIKCMVRHPILEQVIKRNMN
mmetsp:Transcript_1921/g.5323  ORF Transcript_1921/g.5323 Transcript_1921/m.5323 type:complete len:85 (+) Transcript_1921:1636-1890(+)